MILKIIRFSFIILVFSSLITSCKNINSNALFKIPKDGSFAFDSLKMNPDDDYRLGPGDRFSFVFGTNEGEKIVFNQRCSINFSKEILLNCFSITHMICNHFVCYSIRLNEYSNLFLKKEIEHINQIKAI